MLKSYLSRAGIAAAVVAGFLAFGGPAAEAKTHIGIWIGIPGISYWDGPGYYRGIYRHRLSCAEGRRIVDHSGFNWVRAVDCSPRYYHYRALKSGKRYMVTLDSRTGRISYHRI